MKLASSNAIYGRENKLLAALFCIVFIAAIIIAACADKQKNDGRSQKIGSNPVSFVLDSEVSEGKIPDEVAKERLSVLSANYEKWEKMQPHSYKYKYMFLCNCVLATMNIPHGKAPTVTVHYNEGSIKITGFDGQRVSYLEESNKDHDPIEGMFKAIKNGVRAEEYIVRFDPIYGYPKEILLDQYRQGDDDGFYAEVFNFEILQEVRR